MKKILSCILVGAMLVSSVGAVSVFADGSKTCDVQTKTVVATRRDNHKNKNTSAKKKSQQPTTKSFLNNESFVEGVKGAASIIIVGSGLAGLTAVASTLIDFPLVPVITGIAAITGISASVVCLDGIAIAITGANPFSLLMNIATADHVVSFVHHTLGVVKLFKDITRSKK